MVPALFFPCGGRPRSVPAGWKAIKDSKGCARLRFRRSGLRGRRTPGRRLPGRIRGHPVVTSQPGQTYRPLSDAMLKLMNIPKEKLFENSATRLFYKDRPAATLPSPAR